MRTAGRYRQIHPITRIKPGFQLIRRTVLPYGQESICLQVSHKITTPEEFAEMHYIFKIVILLHKIN